METNTPADVVKSELHNGVASLPAISHGEDFQNDNSSSEFITSEQESYAKGFDEALQNIHLKEQFQITDQPNSVPPQQQQEYFPPDYFKQGHPPSNYENIQTFFQGTKNSICRSKSFGYISPYGEEMNSPDPLAIYPSYDSVSSFPPFHFITDMEEQEHLKRERKRIRNRLAASKCRKKRLEREARLEEDVKLKADDFVDLKTRKTLLEKEVSELKNRIQSHYQEGCNV